MAEEDERKGDYYAPRSERFDVVMLRAGVAQHVAKPDDFKRVSVVAREAFGARSDAAVLAAEAAGYQLVTVVNPGGTSDAENQARRRAHEAEFPATDRTKI